MRLRRRPPAPPEPTPLPGYLFVMTYGRSGSTLVQGLLNAIPGYLIRGENLDAVRDLYEFDRKITTKGNAKGRAKFASPTHPFFGIGEVPRPAMLEGVRNLVTDTLLRPEPDTRVTGFKEIRWYRAGVEGYVEWLGEVFPGARFVINTRRHEDVLRSKWWAEGDPEHNAKHLADIEERMLAIAADLGDRAHRVHYDDYVADADALRPLYDWLGEPFDVDAVRATMAVRHSY